ncbi:Protein kinase-like domain protein [Niveomyces insectorum RCEF 264]|uniref:EKC/KEOPS complex subunit BUD32 n=1 Tax=Niveomyces insectorum RCEF 264 TaxID=1081102 RepID=A0A167UZN4_9HYPO|nr:Protein kinase-like domain protein [Niveomyces insectorum RCEF 264]
MAWPIPEKPAFGDIVGVGGSCFVSFVDETTVHKSHQIWVRGRQQSRRTRPAEEELAREAAVLRHLGPHPCIVAFGGVDEIAPGVHALRLERAPLGSLRAYIQTHADAPFPENMRLRMSMDVAHGLAHAHARGVRHCDISCRNLLLFHGVGDGDPHVKICDWAGSIIEGHALYSTCGTYEEMQYELPCRGRALGQTPVLAREIFALGSAIYEIMAWARPLQGLSDDEVEQRYAREEFACLDDLAVAEIVDNCWHERYGSVQAVVQAMSTYVPEYAYA